MWEMVGWAPFFPWTDMCSCGFFGFPRFSRCVIGFPRWTSGSASCSRQPQKLEEDIVWPFTNIERPRKRGFRFGGKKQDKTTSNCQMVRYPLSVLGEYITGKGIAFGVVLTCLRCFQVVCTTQLSFFPPKKHHQLPQQLMSLKPFLGESHAATTKPNCF